MDGSCFSTLARTWAFLASARLSAMAWRMLRGVFGSGGGEGGWFLAGRAGDLERVPEPGGARGGARDAAPRVEMVLALGLEVLGAGDAVPRVEVVLTLGLGGVGASAPPRGVEVVLLREAVGIEDEATCLRGLDMMRVGVTCEI